MKLSSTDDDQHYDLGLIAMVYDPSKLKIDVNVI